LPSDAKKLHAPVYFSETLTSLFSAATRVCTKVLAWPSPARLASKNACAIALARSC